MYKVDYQYTTNLNHSYVCMCVHLSDKIAKDYS